MSKYGVPSRINGKRNPEYWRAYNKTEQAKECGKRYRKAHVRQKRKGLSKWPSKSMGSPAWERDCIYRDGRPEAEAVGSVTADDLRALL